MHEDRESHHGHKAAVAAVWQAELGKPDTDRQWFRIGDLAEELARDPRSLAVDAAIRTHVVDEFAKWIKSEQVNLRREVASITGDPPVFEPLGTLGPLTIRPDPEALLIGREAACRFVAAYPQLPGSARFSQQWFSVVRRQAEDQRARCVNRFIERQRGQQYRRWMPVYEIADRHGLSAGPAGSPNYEQTREFALRSLSRLILDGKFDPLGIMYLTADVILSGSLSHRLKCDAYRHACKAAEPDLPLDVLLCCWLPSSVARQWLEQHGGSRPRDGVVRPKPQIAQSARPRPRITAHVLRKWYTDRIKANQPTNESEDWTAARQQFGERVRRDQIRNLRRELAPASWRRQGRRRNSC